MHGSKLTSVYIKDNCELKTEKKKLSGKTAFGHVMHTCLETRLKVNTILHNNRTIFMHIKFKYKVVNSLGNKFVL
jgi:hypothetical protein